MHRKFSFTFCFFFCCVLNVKSWSSYDLLVAEREIQVQTFRGQAIAPYAEQVFLICMEVYCEYPYLYLPREGDGYHEYFHALAGIDEAIVCIAFDREKVVGILTGLPLEKMSSRVLKVFEGREQNVERTYYLGEFVILPEYRKQGIGGVLYRYFEKTVKDMESYSSIALCQIEDWRYESRKPHGYIPSDGFWLKLGFKHHPEYFFQSNWINCDESEASPHRLVFWMKDVKHSSNRHRLPDPRP